MVIDNAAMLTCYGHAGRLPRGDLTYIAFRVAVSATLDDAQSIAEVKESTSPVDAPSGFTAAVPLLASESTWRTRRHRGFPQCSSRSSA